MKKYDKYKPSGVEWIGEIPEEWEAKRLKYFLTRNDGGVWGNDYDGITANATKVFRSTEINIDGSWNMEKKPALRVLSDHEKEKALLKEGDLLVTKSSGSQLHIGKTALVNKMIEEQECCYSNFMQRLRPLNLKASKFLHIFLNSNLSRDQYNYLSNSTTGLANLSANLINEIILPCPTPEEQTAIANYLDDKTEKIDTLIEKKKKLIELYKEERTAVINQAVTRGINPLAPTGNVKLKDSGIDWLGQIPEHWEVKKLKYVAKLRDELIDESDFKIAVENIESGTGKLVGMEEDKNYQGKLSAFRNGDTIFNKLRPYLHKVYYAEQDGGLFGELLIIYSISELLPKFLFYKLFSKIFIDIVDGSTQGTKMPRANWNDFISLLAISFPKDKDEQLQVVQHIETETKRIDGSISKIEKEIDLLAEYRTALISEVVTGKIDVRNAV